MKFAIYCDSKIQIKNLNSDDLMGIKNIKEAYFRYYKKFYNSENKDYKFDVNIFDELYQKNIETFVLIDKKYGIENIKNILNSDTLIIPCWTFEEEPEYLQFVNQLYASENQIKQIKYEKKMFSL